MLLTSGRASLEEAVLMVNSEACMETPELFDTALLVLASRLEAAGAEVTRGYHERLDRFICFLSILADGSSMGEALTVAYELD